MTRVACFHDFSESPFRARIVDPMNDGNGGCNIDWKFEDCIRAYYAVFLTNKNALREQNFGGRTYKVFDILKSGTVFGVDKEILDAIDANIENFISIHKKIIGDRSNNIQGSDNNSAYDLGKDCVILLDEHRSSFPALSDEKLPLIHLRKKSRN